ncbi:MAG TPA: TSUP family transporter [Verrucomicrobiae bacterium]
MDSLWLYPILFGVGTAAGFVDSIAGGGGVLTIPVLLSVLPMPAPDVLGTNKLQATFGSASATWHYRDAGLVQFRECWAGIAWTALGALGGTLLVANISSELLRKLIPWLLIGIAVYTLVRPSIGSLDAKPVLKPNIFYLLFGLGIGFYDGFFGPGTGSFWAMAYVLCLGYNLTKATAHTKVMNFTSNVVSFAVFAAGNHVLYPAGVVMGMGQLIGARVGSKMVIKKGAEFIRPIFVTAALVITGKLIYQNYFRNN